MLMCTGRFFHAHKREHESRDDRIDAPNWIMGMYSHSLGENTQLGVA